MTMFDLTQLDNAFGWRSKPAKNDDLFSALAELQNTRIAIVSGAAAAVNMTVSGVTTSGSTILSAQSFQFGATISAAPVPRTGSCQVAGDNVITCNESLVGSFLLVQWANKAYRKPIGT